MNGQHHEKVLEVAQAPGTPPVDYISVEDGKYTLIMDPSGLRALRYGETWRDLCGDGFVMALGHEILDLRKRLAAFEWVAGVYEDKGLTRDDVANELHDWHFAMGQVSKVYMHATGGLLSKPNYYAEGVCSAIDDHVNSVVDDECEDRYRDLKGAVKDVLSGSDMTAALAKLRTEFESLSPIEVVS